MGGFLLNLTFNFQSSGAATGLFNDNSADPTSKQWYNVPSNWPGVSVNQGDQVPVDVRGPNWPTWPWSTPPGGGNDQDPLPCAIGDKIYVRLTWNSWSAGPPQNLSFMAAFGRSAPHQALIASPFALPNTSGYPQTMYYKANAGAVNNAWIFYLGAVARNMPGGGAGPLPRHYSFIVNAELLSESVGNVQYGHDPRLVVGGGGGPDR